MELHRVRPAGEAEAEAAERQSAGGAEVAPGLLPGPVHPLVELPPGEGRRALHPHLLQVDQGALPLAEHQVLQGRKRQQVVLGEHHRISSSDTPAGSRSRWTVTA